MSYFVDDTYDIYNETLRKARKAHTCDACKETIAPGHRYTVIFILSDGTKRSLKRCARCQKIHEHLRHLDAYRETWPDERLNCGETYEDEWGKSPPDKIAALAFALPGEVEP